MRILAIESSCDETSAAVVEKNNDGVHVLSNITATSLLMHQPTGGIIPENAAREQVKWILPVIEEALTTSTQGNALEVLKNTIDGIAVTYGPGLIGSLLMGVESARALSFILKKPLLPVNHLLAHLYANFIDNNEISFPFIGLIVSGGHTDLLYFKSHADYTWLGGTRDDAAGEALDKIGRIIGIKYPAGAEIEKRAHLITDSSIKFTSPLLGSSDLDFSFSGLKSEVSRYVEHIKKTENILPEETLNQICFAVQYAIIKVLVRKTLSAVSIYTAPTLLLGGGVSANQTLKKYFVQESAKHKLDLKIYSPLPAYSTDNAAMIGAYALMAGKEADWKNVKANPELYFTT